MGNLQEPADVPQRQAVVVQAAGSTAGQERRLMLAPGGLLPQLPGTVQVSAHLVRQPHIHLNVEGTRIRIGQLAQ